MLLRLIELHRRATSVRMVVISGEFDARFRRYAGFTLSVSFNGRLRSLHGSFGNPDNPPFMWPAECDDDADFTELRGHAEKCFGKAVGCLRPAGRCGRVPRAVTAQVRVHLTGCASQPLGRLATRAASAAVTGDLVEDVGVGGSGDWTDRRR